MKKPLQKVFAILFTGLFFLNNQATAQCSGGVFQAAITPTTITQTVAVPNAGLYYSFSGIGGVTYQFSFCAADGGSASYDTQITMLDNTGAYAGGYNDDWCGLQSYLTWVCPTSGTYRALISRYYCNQNGGTPATLAYKLLPPPNDLCTGATSVADPSVTVGNTAYAGADIAPTCVTTNGTGGGVWYTVMGDGAQMTASLCGSTFDTRIRIFTGSCGSLICETGNDDFCGLQSQASWCSVNNTMYYILVHGSGAASGDFTLTMTETVPTPPTITQSALSYCGSGSITLTASGSSIYNWSPPTGLNTTSGAVVIASPSSTTTYTVAITDAATGCPAYASATVTVNPVPVVTAATSASVICGGGNATLTATGASTYNWMPGNIAGSSIVVSPTVTTTYTVTGTSTLGCTNTATVTVNTYALPPVVASSSSPDICIGSFATLTGSGALTYNWMPGNVSGTSVNFAPSTTTSYTVTGTDGNGCMNSDTIILPVNPLPSITATSTSDTVCTGNSDTLMAFGGVSYIWNTTQTGDSIVVFPNTATTYTVSGTDTNGCVNTGTVSLTVLLASPVTATATYNSVCIGSSTTLTASGAPNYTWMPGNLSGSSITVSPAVTTTYTISGFSTNGCVRTGTITITVNPLPIVTDSASTYSICGGSPVVLTGMGASTYNWSPGNLSGSTVTVNPTASISYIVTGTDVNGCTDTAMVSINVIPAPNITITPSNPVVCSGNPSTLTASGAMTYVWMPGNLTTSTVTVNPVTTTNYTVTGTDANGCSNSTIIPVGVTAPPNVITYASMSTVCLLDANVFLTGIPTGGVWSGPGVSGSQFDPSVAGAGNQTVTYTYTDPSGCVVTSTVSIVVSSCVGISEQSGLNGVGFFPNPNDGTFTIAISSENVTNLKMEILDLQGRVVYAEQIEGITVGFTKSINVNSIANGAYYIKFTSENSSAIQKLMIQK